MVVPPGVNLASPPPIGNVDPDTIAATSLSAPLIECLAVPLILSTLDFYVKGTGGETIFRALEVAGDGTFFQWNGGNGQWRTTGGNNNTLTGTNWTFNGAVSTPDGLTVGNGLTVGGGLTIGVGGVSLEKAEIFTTAPSDSILAGNEVEVTVTATGVAAGDIAIAVGNISAGLVIAKVWTLTDQIKIVVHNPTGGPISLDSTTITILAFKL